MDSNTKSYVGISALESNAEVSSSLFVEINVGGAHGGSWIHPKLAIQLAQWISPSFALQVSDWIITLLTYGRVVTDKKIKKELVLKDKRIKLLEDTYIRKQKRNNYSVDNVIYIVTTEDNKKRRNYTFGKTIDLKARLSVYNKSAEHEVIYYKECKNEDDMSIIEVMILSKLKEYKEKANRDRFILPLENDISLFTNVVDYCVSCF